MDATSGRRKTTEDIVRHLFIAEDRVAGVTVGTSAQAEELRATLPPGMELISEEEVASISPGVKDRIAIEPA